MEDEKHTLQAMRNAGKLVRGLSDLMTKKNDAIEQAVDACTENNVDTIRVVPIQENDQRLCLHLDLNDDNLPYFTLECENTGSEVNMSLEQMARLHQIFGAILGKK